MDDQRKKNRRVVALAGAAILAMSVLVIYAPTLYRMFCAVTGYAGTVRRVALASPSPQAGPGETVTVTFDANVGPGLDWEFRPEQPKVSVRLGEQKKVYYYARNKSDRTIVARATFNVTPYKAAPYFFKIECFCFTEEKLGPGESARMPLVLFIDDQLLKDPNTREVRDITLSYTFFRQESDERAVGKARDLKAGSKALDATLGASKPVPFDNDAPRR